MFSDLLEELDALEQEERKSACLWALAQCASTVDQLSRELEQQRHQLLAGLPHMTCPRTGSGAWMGSLEFTAGLWVLVNLLSLLRGIRILP